MTPNETSTPPAIQNVRLRTHKTRTLPAILAALWLFLPLAAQNKPVEIKGTVIDDDGEAAISVVIRDTDKDGRVYGITDIDGKFTIQADPTTTLHFSGLTYAPKTVKLKGKTNLHIIISYETQNLNEVVIVAKRIVNKLMPEPTDIEIVGNQYIIHPKVKIPKEMYKPGSRIIVQPVLINTTRSTQHLFRPAVVTGKEYGIALERMLEFQLSNDPLSPYYEKTQKVDGNEVVAYVDSLYMDNPDDECRCDIFMYLVDYKKVAYRDTVIIAKGTVNPMRFFDYALQAQSIRSDRYVPRPQKQLRGAQGRVNLTFRVNSDQIDPSDPNNALELEKMRRTLSEIDNDPYSEFLSFRITGISSPEGNYEGNLRLARKRTQTAKENFLQFLTPGTVAALRDSILTDARVEPWNSVVQQMEADSLDAGKLRDILDRYPGDPGKQAQQIAWLPEYKTSIREKYLPRLRRVEYGFNYSVMRLLTDDEIRQLYRESYKKLVPYEFWRLYLTAGPDSLKEKICRQALEQYPGFMLAANELAVRLVNRKQADPALLEPFVSADAPSELLCNQVIALLEDHTYERADSVATLIPDSPEAADVKTIARAFNGDFATAYERFAPRGGVNEVVLLLALKRNDEAWEKAQELPDEVPVNDYLRAVCANRLDLLMEAIVFLKRAVKADPALMDIARIDGDVTDLVQQLDEEKKAHNNASGDNPDKKNENETE